MKIFLKNFIYVFRKSFIHLLPLVIFSALSEQWLSQAIQKHLNSGDTSRPENLIIILALGFLSLLHSFIFPALSTIVIVAVSTSIAPHEMLFKNLSWLIKEELRVWGKSIQWGFLFILPGLWKFIQFSFVPYIVLNNENYQLGQIDALETSKKWTKKYMYKLIGLFVIFNILWPVLSSEWDHFKIFQKSPATALAFAVLEMIWMILFVMISFRWYQKQRSHI